MSWCDIADPFAGITRNAKTSRYKIDEEMEIDGNVYWCNAVIEVEWTKTFFDACYEADKAFVSDLRLFAYDATSDAFEVDLSDPRLLDKAKELAKEWALENAELE